MKVKNSIRYNINTTNKNKLAVLDIHLRANVYASTLDKKFKTMVKQKLYTNIDTKI